MSTRMIVLDSCRHCPSRDHRGSFGRISRVPVCRATGRELPYDLVGLQAEPTLVIPDWCPLPEKDS